MKLLHFSREGLLETYLVQVQLALALEGKVLQVLVDLLPGEQESWPAIRGALQRQFVLDTDASDMRLRAVLSQEGEHGERVAAFLTCSLIRPERSDCVPRRELLVVMLGT